MVDNRTIAPGGFDFAGLRDNTAIPLLAKFGKTATLTVPGGTPANPWEPPPDATDYSVTVVQTELTKRDRTGTVIEDAEIKFLMSTDGDPAPALNCTLTVGSDEYSLVHVEPLEPGAVKMMWYVWCKK